MKPLNDSDMRLLVGLLDDEDPRSQELVRTQILEMGKAALPYLEEAQRATEPRMRRRLASLAQEVRHHELERDFAALASTPEPDLERGAFLIARFGYPGVDEGKYSTWLDDTAHSVGPALEPGSDFYPLLLKLTNRVFEDLGFEGAHTRYYEPDNSYLNRVIDSRRGIPISLSVLYLLLARRLGLPVSGAGIPGRFMVRFELGGVPYFLDGFLGGRVLTREECRRFLVRSGYPFREEFLAPAGSRDILARMMRNLISVYQRSGSAGRSDRLSNLVEILLSAPRASA